MKIELPTKQGALEFRRDQMGLTRTEFAFCLGMQKSHYSEFLRKRRGLPFKAAVKAFKLGVPAKVLLR